jgi:hypothetical protein
VRRHPDHITTADKDTATKCAKLARGCVWEWTWNKEPPLYIVTATSDFPVRGGGLYKLVISYNVVGDVPYEPNTISEGEEHTCSGSTGRFRLHEYVDGRCRFCPRKEASLVIVDKPPPSGWPGV